MNNEGKYILIVDDNLINLQRTAILLKDEGFLISLAQDASIALAQLGHMVPDLILLDIMMPGMDGFELCRIIKKDERLCDIPIIFLTAKNQTEDLTEGFKAGGVDYITKPFKREELIIRVKNHLELAGSRKKILEMNRTRDKLYSIIAHDIRSPFSSIRMTISAIADGYLEPDSNDFREIMKHLEKTANETGILLDNLLAWTKLQSYSIAIDPKTLKIHPLILDCVQLLQGNANNKKISIAINIQEDVQAFFDEVTIHTVFRNLILNAIKFTPENGSIEISSQTVAGFVSVNVKDTGVGIPEEIIKKIFQKNEHYTTPGTKKEQGSGLGTLIVKDFVDKNRGKLEIKSTPGIGTEVMVFLPLTNLN